MSDFVEHVAAVARTYASRSTRDPLLVLERPGARLMLMRIMVSPKTAPSVTLDAINHVCPRRAALLTKDGGVVCRMCDGETTGERTARVLPGGQLGPWRERSVGDFTLAIERAVRRARARMS